MNYAGTYEFAVDARSSPFKAPFNQIHGLHRVAVGVFERYVMPFALERGDREGTHG